MPHAAVHFLLRHGIKPPMSQLLPKSLSIQSTESLRSQRLETTLKGLIEIGGDGIGRQSKVASLLCCCVFFLCLPRDVFMAAVLRMHYCL